MGVGCLDGAIVEGTPVGAEVLIPCGVSGQHRALDAGYQQLVPMPNSDPNSDLSKRSLELHLPSPAASVRVCARVGVYAVCVRETARETGVRDQR